MEEEGEEEQEEDHGALTLLLPPLPQQLAAHADCWLSELEELLVVCRKQGQQQQLVPFLAGVIPLDRISLLMGHSPGL